MRRHARLIAVAVFLALLWAIFQFAGLRDHFTLQYVHDSFEQHVWTGLLLFVALFSLGNLIQIPGWLFLTAAVLALGQLWGGVATYVAACVSSLITFLLIRALGGDALRGFDGRLAQRVFARLDRQPLRSVFVLRLLFQTVPALNYALALSGIRLRDYAVGTALGLPLPIALYSVFLRTLARWMQWPLP
jgi:uncharacterized membrane protein YdjX (TVP38/TMEM64 family)